MRLTPIHRTQQLLRRHVRLRSARDEHAMPMYEMTFDFAQLDQPPRPRRPAARAVAGNQQPGRLRQRPSGTLQFRILSPDNIGRISLVNRYRRSGADAPMRRRAAWAR